MAHLLYLTSHFHEHRFTKPTSFISKDPGLLPLVFGQLYGAKLNYQVKRQARSNASYCGMEDPPDSLHVLVMQLVEKVYFPEFSQPPTGINDITLHYQFFLPKTADHLLHTRARGGPAVDLISRLP